MWLLWRDGHAAILASDGQLTGLALDGDDVVFAMSLCSSGEMQHASTELRRVSRDGGTPIVIATLAPYVRELAVDATHFYMLTPETSGFSVRRLPK